MNLNNINHEFTDGLTPSDEKSHHTKDPNLDGGYGWLIVLASFLMQACSFGVVAGFGVYLEHYRTHVFQGYPSSEIALIGTIAPTTIALASIFTGRLCDLFGFRMCTLMGTILIVLSHILASFSTKVWHFAVTQGFMFGLGGALVYVPANTIVTLWFVKYRGLAVGIGTAGSGIGGLVTSLVNASLLTKLDLVWTLRINAIILGCALLISILIIKPPPPSPSSSLPSSTSQNLTKPFEFSSILLNPRFLLFTGSMLFGGFGYLVPLYYLPVYATMIDLPFSNGAFLVGTVNIASAIGRVILGFIGDKVGHVTIFFLCLAFSSILPIIWLFSSTYATLIVFAILYGTASGGFAGGFPSTCASLFGEHHLATIMGIAYAPTGLGDLLGPPIAGKIYDATDDFRFVIYFTIILYGVSALLVGLTRCAPHYRT